MRNLHTLSVHGDFDGSFLPMGKGVILNMFILLQEDKTITSRYVFYLELKMDFGWKIDWID